MAFARLVAAGLLLLTPRSLALRTSGHGAAATATPDVPEVSLSVRRHRKTHTLHSLREEYFNGVQAMVAATPTFVVRGDAYSAVALSFFSTCRMDRSACRLADLDPGRTALIFPGNRTRCIFGGDFMFQVQPGAADKLLIHLSGGGACWDEMTTSVRPACSTSAQPTVLMGLFNRCPGENPFQGYTVVHVPHCSGDLHAGDVQRPWRNPANKRIPVEQRGYANVRSVLDWVKANMAPQLSELAFTGESAGAIGVQVWSRTVLTELKYSRARVLSDSYVGVFPQGFEGEVFRDLGVCSTGLLQGEFEQECQRQSTAIVDIFDATIRDFPDVAFGNLNSKHDITQIMFHNLALMTQRITQAEGFCRSHGENECDLADVPHDFSKADVSLDQRGYHRRMEAILEQYGRHPNYASYVMSGDAHVLAPSVFGDCPYVDYSSVGATSYWIDGRKGRQRLRVQSWTASFFRSPDGRSSFCENLLEAAGDADDWCRLEQLDRPAM